MKKVMKKMKGKKVLSLVLAALMLATTFSVAVPMLKLDASAAGSISTQDGAETITQTQIVDASTRVETYEGYATQFLEGASRPLDMVIPGLDPGQDYVIQGMTYYPERDWMLITAYHNYDSENDATQFSSKVFALDAATGDFVAMFSFLNVDGTTNVDHGGGIAVSENNIYYACGDADRKIAYAPVSALENAEEGKHTIIQLAGEREFTEVGSVTSDSKTAYTAYVCYDDGILWTGNFYDPGVKILGISVAATDYSVYANDAYKSMVFGYELKGDSSEEEWNNLIGATGTDCQGNPSYAIGLNNAIKDVQYATVDNGKLYLSCSFGTGEGTNSVTLGSMRPYSQLIIADIDLSIAGTKTVTISTDTSGGTRSVLAHDIQNYELYDMMPMSEGLCVIEDKIYITFESASNKYLNEAGTLTGNCNYPIDVVWELDPYALMEVEKAEPENSIYYEKVNGPADIVSGEEYIIVYESDEEDPTTQQKILYAFDADGNFKGHKLSKSTADNLKGYDGMVGHPITEYSILEAGKPDALGNTYNRDILYLDNKEKDDVEGVRWTLSNIGGTKYRIRTTETYFADGNCFYFDANRITMLPNNASNLLDTIDIGQLAADNGYFYLSNNGAYLWCNDGLNADYNTNANAYYTANAGTAPIFSGLTETPGTIHCNALSSALTGGSGVPAAEEGKEQAYPDGAFQLYRRVTDSAASTYESRVYTNLNAELQADGTYTVDLETYAISPNHYQYVGERPTDYILVADSSSSTTTADSTGIISYSSTDELSVETLSGSEDDTSNAGEVCVKGYGFSDPAQDIYFLHTDGNYYKIYLAVATVEFKDYVVYKSIKQRYWAYYVADDGMYYVLQTSGVCGGTDGGVFAPITREEFINHVDNSSSLGDDSQYSAYSTDSGNGSRRGKIVYKGAHYRFTTNSTFTRMDTIKKAVTGIVDSIGAQNPDNRVALVRYGATTEYFHTANGWTNSVPTDGSDIGAFFTASQVTGEAAAGTLDSTSVQTDNSGIELKLANDIVDYSGVDYSSTGDRNVVVIFLSDGIPGADEDTSNVTSAANNVILKAKSLKEKGAFVYSVLTGQASVDGFNKKTFMEAVSTKYAAATAMNNLGGQSIDGVNYIFTLSSCTIDTYLNIGEITAKEVAVNTSIGLANLDASAILRQELSDSFIIPTDTQPQVNFIEGKFDAIGRFAFSETPTIASGVTCNWNPENPELLTVTGYDYSTQYISKGKTGNKLRIRITGVLPDETKTIQNTPISNTSTSALYQNSTQMSNGVVFKALPTNYFNIPKYTYVLDYGLQLLDTDVNGTLKSVSDGLKAQRDENGDISYNDVSENGLVAIQSGAQNLLYHTTPTNTTDSGYVLIQRDDLSYDWFEIKVVPASNVYFEETEFEITNNGKVGWSTQTGGTSVTERNLPNEGDVDGYDAAYDNANTYSNGKTLYTTVDSSNKLSESAKVTFAGNGIDIVSACGPTTGMQIIDIKNAETGEYVAAAVVDTYYADATFSQVPVFSWRGNYGEYIVETSAAYLSSSGALKKSSIKNNLIDTGLVMNSSDDLNTVEVEAMLDAAGVEGLDMEKLELVWFDDNSVLNGGSGVAPTKKGARADSTGTVTLNNYLDGFRIYNPLGSDSSDYAESEQGAVYYNVIDSLVDGTLSDGDLDFTSGTVAFVTGSLADGETLSFSNYESIGPKNELYLKGGASTGVAFNTPVATGGRVMVSLRAVNGTATATINGQSFTINSATEMYYDITDLLNVTNNVANVSIINTGSGILAVNNIKLTNAVATSGLMPLSMDDLETVQYYASAEPVQATVENGVVTPVVEEEVPEEDKTTDNNDTTTDSGESEEFSIFSLIEMLIAFIEKILRGAFGSGNLF